MVAPLTSSEIIAALKKWNIPYKEVDGWKTRTNARGWGDVTGFMWHHTGDDAPDTADLKMVRDGRVGLSGPLCNFGLGDDGTVYLVAAGAANHAGGGDIRVLEAVRNESYTTAPPASRFTHTDLLNGVSGAVIGNPLFYGVECFYYNARNPAQRAMMPRLAAAIIDALDNKDTKNKWSAKSGIGHKEWQRGKIDPTYDCVQLRKETQALLDAGPNGNEEDDMQLSDRVEVDNAEGVNESVTIATLFNRMNWVYNETIRQRAQITKIVAESAATTAALSALNNPNHYTIEEIINAAKAGAAAALDEKITDADVSLTVQP